SLAGNGTFTNNGATVSPVTGPNGGNTSFFDSSSADNGAFTNNAATVAGADVSNTLFFNSSLAGNGTFTNNGATVSCADSGYTWFFDSSSADNGTFTNNGNAVTLALGGHTVFDISSTAGNATLIANGGLGGGGIFFGADSTGGTARVEVFGNGTGDDTNGTLDISFHNAPGVTTGSIEGSGRVSLGAFKLTVGSNNLTTTFSGVIQDGGLNGGTGGSLTKIGK